MSLNQLFDQFLGGSQQPAAAGDDGEPQSNQQGGLSNILPGGVSNQMLGGLAAGGVLGVVLGNKKMRKSATKMAGGAVGLGGAAALGYVAYKAYQNWQGSSGGGGDGSGGGGQAPGSPSAPQGSTSPSQAQQPAQIASPGQSTPAPVPMRAWQGSTPPDTQPKPEDFDAIHQVSSEGAPFQEVLIQAMIAAANADGHIDTKEQFAIFDLIEKMQLEPDDKALVFRTLKNPPDVQTIANSASNLEQASEIYLVSRLAIDPDHPLEWHYLQELSTQLALPADLVDQLEQQLQAQQSAT